MRVRRLTLLSLTLPALLLGTFAGASPVLAAPCDTSTNSLMNGGFEVAAGRAGHVHAVPGGIGAALADHGWLRRDRDLGDDLPWRRRLRGNAFAELNANTPGTLYQDVVSTPGATMTWTLAHRGRDGDDEMQVLIGDANAGRRHDGVTGWDFTSGNLLDGNTAWGVHTDDYVVPGRADLHAVRIPRRERDRRSVAAATSWMRSRSRRRSRHRRRRRPTPAGRGRHATADRCQCPAVRRNGPGSARRDPGRGRPWRDRPGRPRPSVSAGLVSETDDRSLRALPPRGGPPSIASMEDHSRPAGLCTGAGSHARLRQPRPEGRLRVRRDRPARPRRDRRATVRRRSTCSMPCTVAARPLACWITRDGEDWRLTAAPRKDPETGEVYGVAFHLRERSDLPVVR